MRAAPHPHAVVVGGGIAGLAAAHRLRALATAAGADLGITLVEAEPRLGGKILTERHDSLIIEAGPDSFLWRKPAALELCRELGIAERVIGTREDGGGTFILRDGRLEPLPEGITMLVPTRPRPLLGSRLLSTRGKLRLALEAVIPPRRDDRDESVAAFVRRRFGRETFERLAQPLLSGIYAGDAERLSILSTFPQLRQVEREHGSLIRGMLAARRATPAGAPAGPRYTPFVSLAGGMGELVAALVDALDGVDIRLGVAATGLARTSGGSGSYTLALSDGGRLEAGAVLLATPAYAAAELLGELDAELARLVGGIPYVSTATVMLAYRRADLGQTGAGRGFVIPRVEDRELTAVTWVTGKFAGRAPHDTALIRAFVGRAGREAIVDAPDAEILGVVRRELSEILGLSADPARHWIYRWRRALPQYVLGHSERLGAIDHRLRDLPGLSLIGSAYRGVGIPDCVASGRRAAEDVAALVGIEAPTPSAPRERVPL